MEFLVFLLALRQTFDWSLAIEHYFLKQKVKIMRFWMDGKRIIFNVCCDLMLSYTENSTHKT